MSDEKRDAEPVPFDEKEINRRAVLAANDVYKAVYCQIYDKEPRGFNAHQRAQAICEEVKIKVIECLHQYRSHLESYQYSEEEKRAMVSCSLKVDSGFNV